MQSHSSSSSSSLNNQPEGITKIAKSFVLKHVFENAADFENDQNNSSKREEHFGIKWLINLIHVDDNLEFYLHVSHPGQGWEIETESQLRIIGSEEKCFTITSKDCFTESGGSGLDFLKWKEVIKNYLVDGKLTAEAYVKIIETKGLRKKKIRRFDESAKDVSDIVLLVKERKFHVLKKYLAAQSSFFKALLLGNFAESKKPEVTLTGIDPEDFHFFLEVLYGEDAIDETNVEGIALLADMYDAPTAIRRCEGFLLEKSTKKLKRKLQVADQYHLDVLKKKCLSEIKTPFDLNSIVPDNIKDLEHSTVVYLLEKAISMNK